MPAAEAVAHSVAALRWLIAADAKQFFFKYCSTFDSTDAGNIGPVADALLERSRTPTSLSSVRRSRRIAAPSIRGYLFIGDGLLSESGMRDHPLTPMRDANLRRVLSRQTPHKVGLVPLATVSRGVEAVRADFARLRRRRGAATPFSTR